MINTLETDFTNARVPFANKILTGFNAETSVLTIPNDVYHLPNDIFEHPIFDDVDIREVIVHEECIFDNTVFNKLKTIKKVVVHSHYIPTYAFSKCKTLESVILTNLTSIPDSAFAECSNLSEVILPDTVKYIQSSAFTECTSLTSIKIPDSVLEIGNWAFDECYSLTNVTINKNTIFHGRAFARTNIPNVINIHNSVELGGYIGCKNITELNIPENIECINREAFYNSGLTHLFIPKTVKEVSSGSFAQCKNLKEVVVEDFITTTSISSYAFEHNDSLEKFIFNIEGTTYSLNVKSFSFYTKDNLINIIYSLYNDEPIRIHINKNEKMSIIVDWYLGGKNPKTRKYLMDNINSVIDALNNEDNIDRLRTIVKDMKFTKRGMTKILDYIATNYSQNTELANIFKSIAS